jgi:adenylate kinase
MNRAHIIVFMGPPGSGKGSLSQLCVKNFGWTQLSTGSLCRKHREEKTPLGQTIESSLKSGKLISDDVMLEMVRGWLDTNLSLAKAVILDGFPRTHYQAQCLDNLMARSFGSTFLHIIKLRLSHEAILDRLAYRSMCSNRECQSVFSIRQGSPLAPRRLTHCDKCDCLLERRDDDTGDIVKERLMVYQDHEAKLIDYYTSVGAPIVELNVDRPIDDIFCDFKNMMLL